VHAPFRSRPTARGLAAVCVQGLLVMVLGGAVAACSGAPTGPASGGPAAAADMQATMAPSAVVGDPGAGMHADIPTADDVAAGWAARPEFVATAAQRTQAAYAFSLARPDVLRFLPCYCGCVAMEHRSNLDCFIKPGGGSPVAFEEHASFCDICVETALLAKKRMAEGRSLAEIRAEVDATWGGGAAPGTDTPLPQG